MFVSIFSCVHRRWLITWTEKRFSSTKFQSKRISKQNKRRKTTWKWIKMNKKKILYHVLLFISIKKKIRRKHMLAIVWIMHREKSGCWIRNEHRVIIIIIITEWKLKDNGLLRDEVKGQPNNKNNTHTNRKEAHTRKQIQWIKIK